MATALVGRSSSYAAVWIILALTSACFHFSPALMIAAVCFSGFFFALGSLCFCGLLKIVSDMHGSFVDVLKSQLNLCFIYAVALLQMLGSFEPCRAVDKDSKLRLII